MDIQNELRTIIAAFNGASIEYALCGGLAVAFHGYARFTKDIDILVSRDSLAKALDIAAHVGFLDSSGKISFPGVELHRVLKTEKPKAHFRVGHCIPPAPFEHILPCLHCVFQQIPSFYPMVARYLWIL